MRTCPYLIVYVVSDDRMRVVAIAHEKQMPLYWSPRLDRQLSGPDIIRDDMAFIDRLHYYLPGWEVPKMRTEHFTDHYGFVVDYLAEALRELRKQNYTETLDTHFTSSFQNPTTKRERQRKIRAPRALLELYCVRCVPRIQRWDTTIATQKCSTWSDSIL